MADSTRRSGRATKGQHRNLDETEAPAPAKKATGRGKKKNQPEPEPEEEPDAIIRCVCGCTTEEEDDERKMICCENCEAWQHNECMEVSENDDDLPEKYYCEQCKAEDHKGLLKKMARGEKPWVERAQERERQEEEKKAKKGKSKKGKKGRSSMSAKKEEVKTNGAEDHEGDTIMTEDTAMEEPQVAPDVVPESPQVSNNKRKMKEDQGSDARSPNQVEPAPKVRKPSSPVTSSKPPTSAPPRRKSTGLALAKRDAAAGALQTELVDRIQDLNSAERQRVAQAFLKLFQGQVKQAQKEDSFSLAEGQSVEDYALKLALSVEYAIYLNFFGTGLKASDDYADKFRAISHNVKNNASLRDRILSGDLSPNDLSKMSRDDMASRELQEKKEQMKQEAEKQHMLIQEEGPRIRRTHKGEELVGDETQVADTTEAAFGAPIRKRPSEIDNNVKQDSPEPISAHSPEPVELPEQIEEQPSEDKKPLTIDTQATPPVPAASERKTPSTFNIDDVWSGVKEKNVEQRPRQPSKPSEPAAPPVKQQPDADIDQLLNDDDPEDEEPYSPVDYTADPNAPVWHGRMDMPNIAKFSGRGKHVAGANLSANIPWSQLLPTTLTIEGRIHTNKADDYLCGLRYSNTTELCVVAVTPSETHEDLDGFEKLFKYFTERGRYGVIAKNPVSSVKDTYVVPLEAGTAKKPEFIELLDDCNIEFPAPERMLLLSFVIKMNNSPSAQQTPRAPDVGSLNSPVAASGNQPTPISGHPGFQNSPTPNLPFQPPPQQYPNYAGSPPQAQGAYVPPQSQQSPFPNQHSQPFGPTGMAAARQTLGELANEPAIAQLIQEAPNSGVPELLIVKELVQNVPAAKTNFGMLSGMLMQRLQQQQGNGNA